MPHTPESEIIEGENARKQEIYEMVEGICQKMKASESMDELKPLFADAFANSWHEASAECSGHLFRTQGAA